MRVGNRIVAFVALTLVGIGQVVLAQGEVKVETGVSYLGAPNNIRVSNGTVELILTTDYGPRIMRYALVGSGEDGNLFATMPGVTAQTEFGDWRIRGGHRLWHAPEAMPRTYEPDNDPVKVEMEGTTVKLIQATEKRTGIAKEIWVTLDPQGSRVTVQHKLTNRGHFAVELSAWALSVMNTGGKAILPQEPYKAHKDGALLPVRPLVLWAYTNLADPRWTLGKSLLTLRQDVSMAEPQKVGLLNKQGWAAYARKGTLFLKRYAYEPGKLYPDFHCNTEVFTNDQMLEVETLGPLTNLQPGESVVHTERWFLFKREVGATEAAMLAALQPILAETAPAK